MKDESAFEFVLLERMAEEYQTFLLARERITHERAREIRLASRLQYPTLFMKHIESFDGVLPEAPPSLCDQFDRHSPQFESTNPRAFLLKMWPHLLWVVHVGEAELTWGGEFQPKFPVDAASFEPGDLRPGQWCRHTLEKLADKVSLIDGWDEHVVLRMQFGDQVFDGDFVFGLLQQWRRVR
jgi:hypothetical protein